MANQEHLEILKQGVAAWNQWRKEHNDIIPDLRDAHLRGADLSRADLRDAHLGRGLSQRYLGRTNLSSFLRLCAP